MTPMTTMAVTDRMVSMSDQVLKVCPTVNPKYSLTSQKPASLTWERNTEPAPIASTRRAISMEGMSAASGAMIPAAVTVATVADPVARRTATATSQPASSSGTAACWIQVAMMPAMPESTRVCLKPPPGAHDEQDPGDRPEGGAHPAGHLVGAQAQARAEQAHRDQDGDQQRHDGLADEQGGVRERIGRVLGHQGLHDGAQEHEHHGQQDDGQGGAEGRARPLVGPVGAAERLGRLDGDPPGHDARGQGAGDDDGGHGHQQPQAEGHPEVRADGVDGDERTGVRGHEAVEGGQAGERRHTDQDERLAGAPRDDHDHGDEQDDADLEEQGDPHDEGDERHGPRQAGAGHARQDGIDDLVGPTGVDEQSADDRPEGDKGAHAADRRSQSGGEGREGVGQRDAGDDGEYRRAECEGEERMHLAPHDERDDGGYAEDRGDNQSGGTVGMGHRCRVGGGKSEYQGGHRCRLQVSRLRTGSAGSRFRDSAGSGGGSK